MQFALRLVAYANSPTIVELIVELIRRLIHRRIIKLQLPGISKGMFQNNSL